MNAEFQRIARRDKKAFLKINAKKKKYKKAKWLPEEDLQIAEKKREAKGKGEKERYAI